MRYLLFPDEERTFLRHLEETFALVPLTPSGARAADGIPGPGRDEGPSGPPNRELVFWARDAGPLVRLSDPPTPHDAAGRVMRQVNRDAGVPDDAVDRERTPVIVWSRPWWYDADRRWIVPSRLGSTAAPVASLPRDYLALYRAVERVLRKRGERLNSWDLSGAEGGDGLRFCRPRNVRSYGVTVWPRAADWLRDGGRIYHWDC